MITEYVLRNKSGKYFVSRWGGSVTGTTDNIYKTPRFTERGAKSARGWITDKEQWAIVPVTVEVKEAE
ncbi:hypothetical protein [Brevibacillus brevis]|uniref:hypothetical protein n=1 Tax=Brevibacillus brevis TaxID=1393 RepID=UPI00165E73B2|nr:hypothetical protein [Brevibacillus brevis]